MTPRPLRILCVDDDPQVRSLLQAVLLRRGHNVEAVADPSTAAEKVRRAPAAFDLIITDTRMPGGTGVELVSDARTCGYKGSVIVFAGLLSDDDRREYEALGVDYIIDKPAQDGELFQAVTEIAQATGQA